jgi:hypothetical protein
MRLKSERGEGRLSAIIWLVVLAAAIYAGFHVGPVYYGNYQIADKMVEVARLPRGTNTDDKILDILMKEVREDGLGGYLNRQQFLISTYEGGRRISCQYERTVDILPGWTHTFKFVNKADQPLIY